jgi:flagellar hook protein FlgE
LATFTNADALDRLTGNVFERSVASGEAVLREVRTENPLVTDDIWEFANFMPEYHELSNIDLQNQFTYMIMSQQAYNSSATVFKSIDEMTKMAASLKT